MSLHEEELILVELDQKIEEIDSQLEYVNKSRKKNRLNGTNKYREWYFENRGEYNHMVDNTLYCFHCSQKLIRSDIAKDHKGNPIYTHNHPTLDHLLPKSLFPKYADNTANFVISCWKCNKKKGTKLKGTLNIFLQRALRRLKNLS